jgi:hypothetical protein
MRPFIEEDDSPSRCHPEESERSLRCHPERSEGSLGFIERSFVAALLRMTD